MIRNKHEDINTPDHYDKLFFGKRAEEMPAFQHIVEKLQSLNRGGKALDIGCGIGNYFHAFEGCEIYGTELSTKAIEHLKDIRPDAKVCQWLAGRPLPFDNNFFNLIWCGEVLEHLENPRQLIEECHRVLDNGGIAFFTTPYGKYAMCDEHLWLLYEDDILKLFEGFDVEIETWPPKKKTPNHFHVFMQK